MRQRIRIVVGTSLTLATAVLIAGTVLGSSSSNLPTEWAGIGATTTLVAQAPPATLARN